MVYIFVTVKVKRDSAPFKCIMNIMATKIGIKEKVLPRWNGYGKQAASLDLLQRQAASDVTKHLPLYPC